MEPASGSGAGAGDVAAVLRDLRFHQYDVEHHSPPFHSSAFWRVFLAERECSCQINPIVIHYVNKFNHIIREKLDFHRK